MISSADVTVATKLILAAVLGGLVGLEREHDKRPAGLRTNILICLGAAMFGTIGSTYFTSATADVSRMWQNIITGVGFLGAGAVIKEEHSVHGLTTAAGIWAVAAVGLAVAAGEYFMAIVAEVIILITLMILRRVEHHFSRLDATPSKQEGTPPSAP